jgi:uncharacterized protein YlxW (UPF0749 family)
MPTNVQLLRRRRDQMEKKVNDYATKVQFYANKLRSSRIKLKTYNRKIEKALEAMNHVPKNPTRVVEV